MPIDDIVNVQITRETQTVSQAGFGTLMILGTHKSFNEKIKYYSNITEVGVDFSSNSLEYISAQDTFAQSPRPTRLAIGRRDSDDVSILIETAQGPFNYTTTINGTNVTIPSLPTAQESKVVLDADLITGNYVGVTMNASPVETVNTVLEFDIDFVTANSIIATVNGTPLGAVPYNASHAQTLIDLAVAIQADGSVTTATVSDSREITIVFASVASNVLDSVVTTGGASQPVATIFSSQFLFTTSHLITMQSIKTAMALETDISSVDLTGATNRILTVFSDPNKNGIVNAFTINGGVTQAGAVITTSLQLVSKLTISNAMVTAINSAALGVTALDNLDDTYSLSADVAGVPYTVDVNTTIINPNEAKINVSQVRPLTKYTVTIKGIDSSYTSLVNVVNNETIAAGLVLAISNNPLVTATAVDNLDGTFELSDSTSFSLSVSEIILSKNFGLIIDIFTPSGSVTDDLDAIENENSDWYAIASTSRVQAVVESIAGWVETKTKIFGTSSSDLTIINVSAGTDITSIAAVLNQLSYVRTFVMYHQDSANDFPECAWFGKVLPSTPGSVTWKFKTLANISYNNLTTTQSLNARNKKANTFEFIGGVGITREGTMAQGEFIDIIRGVDWLTARIQEFVYALLAKSPKIPYTDNGIASIEAEVRRALEQGVSNNFIATDPQYTVTVPKASTVSPANKSARLLQDVVFNATLAGAVHAVEINGTVSV